MNTCNGSSLLYTPYPVNTPIPSGLIFPISKRSSVLLMNSLPPVVGPCVTAISESNTAEGSLLLFLRKEDGKLPVEQSEGHVKTGHTIDDSKDSQDNGHHLCAFERIEKEQDPHQQ